MNNTVFYSLLMLFAGIGIPVMATLNAGLGRSLQSPSLAVIILLIIGIIVASTYLLAIEGLPIFPQTNVKWYFYLGGVLFVFYILSITWVVPRFGVSNAVAFVLLGQLLAMTVIDHFGLLGATQFGLTIQRFVGLLLMCAGVYFVVSRPSPL